MRQTRLWFANLSCACVCLHGLLSVGKFLGVFVDNMPYSPLDLLVDSDRNLTYVATLTYILTYSNLDGGFVSVFISTQYVPPTQVGQVVSFSYIDQDENGNILASDRYNSRILWFPVTETGQFGGDYTVFAFVSIPRDLLALNSLSPSVVLVDISIGTRSAITRSGEVEVGGGGG